MGLVVEPNVVEVWKALSGQAPLRLTGPDQAAVMAALEAARSSIQAIRHPEEPDDPLSSFMSDVTDVPGGGEFWFDMADAEEYEGLVEAVLEAAVGGITRSGLVEGVLAAPFDEYDLAEEASDGEDESMEEDAPSGSAAPMLPVPDGWEHLFSTHEDDHSVYTVRDPDLDAEGILSYYMSQLPTSGWRIERTANPASSLGPHTSAILATRDGWTLLVLPQQSSRSSARWRLAVTASDEVAARWWDGIKTGAELEGEGDLP